MEQFLVPEEAAGERIDAYMARELGESRGKIQGLLKRGDMQWNGKIVRSSQTVKLGDVIAVDRQATIHEEAVTPPELDVLYQDDDVVVVNKPAGISVHPGSGKRVAAISDALKLISSDPDPDRPGIVHRLDRDTSGVMIAARTPEAKTWLMRQFKERLVQKDYVALVIGRIRPTEAIINLPLARSAADPLRRAPSAMGKPAETRYVVTDEFAGYSLVSCHPLTGRTHQIRAHFTAIGHPIAGDRRYGAPLNEPRGLKRQFLHAERLTLQLPSGESKTFTAPLPHDLAAILKTLRASV